MTDIVDLRRSWTLTIPAPGDWKLDPTKSKPVWKPAPQWLSMNSRLHWRTKDRIKKKWRAATRDAALAVVTGDGRTVRLPEGEVQRARIDVMLHFATRPARRDLTNWHETTKVVLDTLTRGTVTYPGWGFLPDDEPDRYLHCPDCPHIRAHPQRLDTTPPYGPVGLLVMTLTDITEEGR